MQIEIISYFNLKRSIEVTTHRLIVFPRGLTRGPMTRHARVLYDNAADSPSTSIS